ncbi:MAG: hypothetical protein ACYC5Q_13280 [Thermoleophilia bacterium]
MTGNNTTGHKRVERPSALTMITAAAASAAAFFVITKSGLAGTLMGAAVFSAVYHGASHWLGSAVERAATWWLARRRGEEGERHMLVEGGPEYQALTAASAADSAAVTSTAADPAAAPSGDLEADSFAAFAIDSPTDSATDLVAPPGTESVRAAFARVGVLARALVPTRPAGVRVRRVLAVWGPLVLALAALGASGYSVVTGEPIERVIIRERVVEKPVIEERVVVQRETVTVTVTVPSGRDVTGNVVVTPTSSTTTSTSTSTTVPGSTATTSTTLPGGAGGSTTTTEPAPTSSSTSLPVATTIPSGG